MLEGFSAGFSAACSFNKDYFLFCATVEKVNNWVDDGAVAGSYIGLADFNGKVKFITPLKDNGKMIKQKIESIEIKDRKENGSLDIYAIADNDDGKSTWYLLRLIFSGASERF